MLYNPVVIILTVGVLCLVFYSFGHYMGRQYQYKKDRFPPWYTEERS